MSGAPIWQIKRKMEQHTAQNELRVQELMREIEEKKKPAEAPNVLVDSVASGLDGKAKPLVRHVLVKDLNKVAQMKRIEFPLVDVFEGKAPMGLYAVFDGQFCGAVPGPAAAEFCARNMHMKVMENLAMLKHGAGTEPFVKAALIKSFQDLDTEYLAQNPAVEDGCGAALALLIGSHAFVATLGRCSAVLAEADPASGRPRPHTVTGRSAQAVSSASLGEPAKKKKGGPGATCIPEVQAVALRDCKEHPFLLLASSAMAAVMAPEKLVERVADFQNQPRIACSELLARASEASKPGMQSAAAQVCFLPPREGRVSEAGASQASAASGPPPDRKSVV